MPSVTLYEALEAWKNREQNLARLFSDTSLQSRPFLKSKLKHFRELNDTYGRRKELKGDVGLNLVRGEINLIERQLYPRLMERLLRKMIAKTGLYFGPDRLLEREIARINRAEEKSGAGNVLQDTGNTQKKARGKSEKSTLYVSAINQQSSLTTNVIVMIEKNYDYLSNQLKYTGFGEDLQAPLKQKMEKGEPQFMLTSQKDYGNDQTAATLHFRKSDESEMYFFNRFTLMLKNDQHPDAIKQTFFINPKDDNITLKEAYNLMSGRAVHKELSTKEGEKYNAWLQLDFKDTDANGNYKVKKFHESYGYNLQATLNKHPIKELQNETDAHRLVASLERGNRQAVTLEIKGKEQNVFIESVPQFKSLNFYDASNQRLRTDQLYEKASPEPSVKEDKKQSLKSGVAGDDSEPDLGPKKTKRIRQNIT